MIPGYLPNFEEDLTEQHGGVLEIENMTMDLRDSLKDELPGYGSSFISETSANASGTGWNSNGKICFKKIIKDAMSSSNRKKKSIKVASELDAYGNLTVSNIDQFKQDRDMILDIEPAISVVINALMNRDVLVVRKGVTYDEIQKYAMHELKQDWTSKNIIKLCRMVCGGSDSFNDTKKAIYIMKPSLKGMIKSYDTLNAMKLTDFFNIEDFSEAADEVIALMFKSVIVHEEQVDNYLLFGLSDHGNQYIRFQYDDGVENYGIMHREKFKYAGDYLESHWIISKVSNDVFDLSPKYIPNNRGLDKSQLDLKSDMKQLTRSLGRKVDSLPIKVSNLDLDQIIEGCGRGIIGETLDQGEMPLIHSESLPAKYELNIRGIHELTGASLRDTLKKYKVSGSGNKDELIAKFCKMICSIYENSFDELYDCFKDYRGIVINRTLSSFGTQRSNRSVERQGRREQLSSLVKEPLSDYYEIMIIELISYVFIKLHTSHDTIYNPMFTNDLYNVEGLVDHIIKDSAQINMTLIPEMKELNGITTGVVQNENEEEEIKEKETPCPF